ncbi:lysophospholipid acyltransferase family protein [Acinetobacter apis]|uniref:1-acyl-sn-glycerol-3-phosphate acyltransferases n=1 Tax=Acinetobacter apis TaxID=1229165 RepID=A0A217EH84_9GAMM|nr:lysophospholipid acyltransferase family protein [Acinetobacter apis]SNQ29865.1 1-acyl-sn-glycerol-3-phosphate acyltransferases [Acinetobacter apis]
MLKRKFNYAWRVGATAFSFASFGVGGIAIGTLLGPALKLKKLNKQERIDVTQTVIQQSFYHFVEMMVQLGIMTYEVDGLDKLKNSQQELVIANHPTLIDVVLIIGLMEKANCVVKQALWKNIFTAGPVKNANYILNEGSEQFMNDCVARLHEDGAPSLVIFPEGTRTVKENKINLFQRGAANIALRTNVPIRPVIVTCSPSTLSKNERWYHIPDRPFHISIRVLDPIYVQDIVPQLEVTPKNVRILNQYLYQFFNRELSKQ